MLHRSPCQDHDDAASPAANTDASDAGSRVHAVRQLSDPHALIYIRTEDADRLVRDAASDRLRQLLVGGDASLSLEQRLNALAACDDATLLAHVARRGREADIRLAAVQRLCGDRLLAEVVREDADNRVRRAAVMSLGDVTLLAELEQHFRKRDARLARQIRQRRESLEKARQWVARDRLEAEALCDELQAVLDSPVEHAGAKLDRLANRRGRLGEAMPTDCAKRFDTLMARARGLSETERSG